MGRRTLLLITSVLIAAIGTALIGLYIKGADQRAATHALAVYGPSKPTPKAKPTPTASAAHGDIQGIGMTIEVPAEDRAVGLLLPGDQVVIYLTKKTGDVSHSPVVSGVKVVSVGPKRSVNGSTGEQIPTTVIGLDVSRDEARSILSAQTEGKLTVAVLGGDPTALPTES